MEASAAAEGTTEPAAADGFAPQEIAKGDDPFAGSDFGDFGDPEPESPEPPASEGPLPIVNREGEVISEGEAAQPLPPAPEAAPAPVEAAGAPVEAAGGLPTLTPEQAAQNAKEYAERTGTALPEATQPAPPTPNVGPTHQMAGADTSAMEPTAELEPDPTPEAPAESGGPTEDPTPASSPPQAEADDGDAEPPAERTVGGKRTHRRYLIFRQDGPEKFTQLSWHEKDGKLVDRGTSGSKRQKVYLARGTEDAMRFGYIVCGRPNDGVTLAAVAQLHFQAKPVRPKPPEPSRERLQIG